MNESPAFDLVYIIQTIRRRKTFILTIAVLAAVMGLISYLLRPRQYRATTEFFIASPFYTDRNNLYRTVDHAQFIGYYAAEEDIDKVIGITETEQAKRNIIDKAGLAKFYKLDTNKRANMEKLIGLFTSNFDIKRSEFQFMQLTYTAKDPKVAANTANIALKEVERIYSDFHIGIRHNVYNTVAQKIHETDSAIASMTDTLARLRDRYNFYDIVSPARQNVITGNIHNSAPGFGYGIEQIQNIEAIKDQLVTDRVRYMSSLNEFSTTNKADEMPLFKVISPARPPLKPSGTGLISIIITCLGLGAFISILWVLLSTFIRNLSTTTRP